MLRLTDLVQAFEAGKNQYHSLMQEPTAFPFYAEESYGAAEQAADGNADADAETNRIACGNNLPYMLYLIKEKNLAGKLQLIYVDPPFFSNGKYQASMRLETENLGKSSLMKLAAYDDTWCGDMGQYLTMLTVRLFAMKELLSETGCIWVHLDWHVAHYIKVILDQIFGENNFINEVVWTYKSGGTNYRSFARKHDTLLLYGKSRHYKFIPLKEKSYNRELKQYRFQGVEEFRDERGWYTMVNMKDVWSIDMVGRTSGERTGYATQKPERLLERIVASCSDEGDLCADFFAGSGTLGAVCQRMNRRWLMCDEGKLSAAEQIGRLGRMESCFQVERMRTAEGCAGSQKEGPSEPSRTSLNIQLNGNEIRLLSYDVEIPSDMKRYAQELQRYRADDSLCFIKCWSVDLNYDGAVHRAKSFMTGKQRTYDINGNRDCLSDGCSDESTGVGNIVGYDVLGNRFSRTFEIECNISGENNEEKKAVE